MVDGNPSPALPVGAGDWGCAVEEGRGMREGKEEGRGKGGKKWRIGEGILRNGGLGGD